MSTETLKTVSRTYATEISTDVRSDGEKNSKHNLCEKYYQPTSANTGLPTSLRYVQIAYGDFGNPEHVI